MAADEEQVFEDSFFKFFTEFSPEEKDGTPASEEVARQIFRAGWESVLDFVQPVGDSRYMRYHLIQLRQDLVHEQGRVDQLLSVLSVIATATVTEPGD
jgi:hypothetical protein